MFAPLIINAYPIAIDL